MTCEYDNLESKAAYSDLLDTIKLLATEMDVVAAEHDRACDGTDKKRRLKYRLENLDEIYDRLCDLSEMVNVKENGNDDDTCDDDDCDCHQ